LLLAPATAFPSFAQFLLSQNRLGSFGLRGFPMMADPQVMRWYRPACLASLIPGS